MLVQHAATLKETNLDVSPNVVTTNVGNIVTPLKTNIEIFKDGNKLNFNTNSLTTNLDFTVGAYTTNYFGKPGCQAQIKKQN